MSTSDKKAVASIAGKDICTMEGARACRLVRGGNEAYFIRLKEPTRINKDSGVTKTGSIVVQFKGDKTNAHYTYDSASFSDNYEIVTPSKPDQKGMLRTDKLDSNA